MKHKSDAGGFIDMEQFTHIAIVNVASGELEQVTEGKEYCHLGTWSPDGKYLTYLADKAEDLDFSFNVDIYLLELESKQSHKLTEGSGAYYQTAWSLNSRYLSFCRWRTWENATQAKLWIYDMEQKLLNCVTSEFDAPVGDYVIGDFLQGVASPRVQWMNDNHSFYFKSQITAMRRFITEI